MVKAVESTVSCKHFRIAFCLAFLLLWNLSGTSQAFSIIGRSISNRSDGGSLSIVRPSSARFRPTPLASTIENEPAAARSSIKARTPKIITIETKRMPSRESLSSTVNLPTPRRTRDLSKQGTITPKSTQASSEAPATTTSRPRRPLLRLMDNIWYILCPDLRKLSRHRRDLDSNKFVVSVPFRKEFAAVFLYLALGVISYRYIFEHWSLVDALYFTCVTFSTVGYGDICAKTVAGKLFSCVFGISGIALLGAAVARIGSRLVQAEMDAVKQTQKQSQRQLLQLNDKIHLDAILPHPHFPPFLATFWKAARYIIQSLAVVAAGGLFIGFLEGWKWYDSLYYGLMTGKFYFTAGMEDMKVLNDEHFYSPHQISLSQNSIHYWSWGRGTGDTAGQAGRSCVHTHECRCRRRNLGKRGHCHGRATTKTSVSITAKQRTNDGNAG